VTEIVYSQSDSLECSTDSIPQLIGLRRMLKVTQQGIVELLDTKGQMVELGLARGKCPFGPSVKSRD